ncbi:unnamed protein product [Dicrocoelium dendriticum]|nr:unnamed protein product [Dicrocoelium dendriticum]
MTPKEDIEVTHEDQQRINSFSIWNLKYRDFTGEYEQKKKELANLNDAEDELILSELDTHPYLVGETFFHLPTDDVNTELSAEKERVQSRAAELEELISDSRTHMLALKKELYAKFGNHINLEED